MLLPDSIREGRVTASTSRSNAASAIGIVLICAQFQQPPVATDTSQVKLRRSEVEGSAPLQRLAGVSAAQFLAVFNKIHDEIVVNQIDLDADARALIFEARWDLYE